MIVRNLLACLVALALSAFLQSSCHAIQVTWDGPEDDEPCCVGDGIHWGNGFNWDTDTTPGTNDDADIGDHTVLIATTNIFFVADLDVGVDGVLNLEGTLNSTGGDVDNGGLMFVDSGVAPGAAGFVLAAGTLEGLGEVVLGESIHAGGGSSLVGPPTSAVTHVAGHTIRGEGQIAGNWINESLIRAEDIDGNLTGVLRISPNLVNNNIIRSTSTATIRLENTFQQGALGRLIADANAIELVSSAITGGTMESTNGGSYVVLTNTSQTNLADLTLLGDLNIRAGSTMTISGTGITNNQQITVNDNNLNSSATVNFSGTPTLGGTGTMYLNRESNGESGKLGARIVTAVDGSTMTHGAGHSIVGEGAIFAKMINNGLIAAEDRNGDSSGVLLIGSPNSGGPTNNHLIRANSGGIVEISTTLTQSATGRLFALDGGGLRFHNGTVIGGSVETQGTAVATVTNNSIFENVTSDAVINIPGGGASALLSLRGTHFTNDGTITVNNTVAGLTASVDVVSDLELIGSGTIVLNASPISLLRLIGAGRTVTQQASHTIRGIGQVNGASDTLLINNGTLEGFSPTQLLEINAPVGGSGLLRNVRIDGVHSPGESTASVPLEGRYTINNFGGNLKIEIGGTTAGTEYDQLVSVDPTNQITIGTSATTLNVSFLDLGNSYVPLAGDRFTIMSSPNSIVGEFNTINLPGSALGMGIHWAPVDRSDPTKYVLEIASVSAFSADFDNDGDVDGDDLDEWQAAYGVNALADADGDGDSDGRDFLAWQRQFGSGVLPPAASQAVPEPSALVLAILTVFVGGFTRGSRLDLSTCRHLFPARLPRVS